MQGIFLCSISIPYLFALFPYSTFMLYLYAKFLYSISMLYLYAFTCILYLYVYTRLYLWMWIMSDEEEGLVQQLSRVIVISPIC